jgi:RNA polymerase sigma factor (sigma-70 family)
MTANLSLHACLNRRPPPVDARQVLAPQQLDELWAAYLADRSDPQLRNRLVEHYRPWIRHMAATFARRMRLDDEENAVGEALAALVGSVIPNYDGTTTFHRWARICTRRKLLDIWREQRRADAVFANLLPQDGATSLLELLPDREQRGCDLKFLEIAAELSDQQAMVLWLRYYRGMSVKAVAAMLKVSPSSVTSWTLAAVKELKKTWFGCMKSDLHAY